MHKFWLDLLCTPLQIKRRNLHTALQPLYLHTEQTKKIYWICNNVRQHSITMSKTSCLNVVSVMDIQTRWIIYRASLRLCLSTPSPARPPWQNTTNPHEWILCQWIDTVTFHIIYFIVSLRPVGDTRVECSPKLMIWFPTRFGHLRSWDLVHVAWYREHVGVLLIYLDILW